MKRFLTLLLSLSIFVSSGVYAVEDSVTQKFSIGPDGFSRLTFYCTGTDYSGSIRDTAMCDEAVTYLLDKTALNKVWYLYSVTALPTSGGTAPDAASVFVLDSETSLDLLGSEDNSTAYNGLNLIDASYARSVFPNIFNEGQNTHKDYFYPVTENLTLQVADQATNSADWTIIFKFVQ